MGGVEACAFSPDCELVVGDSMGHLLILRLHNVSCEPALVTASQHKHV